MGESGLNQQIASKNLFSIKMNTNQIGKITELEVLLYMQKLGYSISIPFGDKDRYD